MDKHTSPTNTAELSQVISCACFNLRKASRIITQRFDEALKPSGLLITQFTILAAIALTEEATMNELADRLLMDRTTLTRNLRPLERKGWLQIVPGQDRRTRIISLTAPGKAALHVAFPLWKQAQDIVVKTLGNQRWSTLLENLSDTTVLMR